MQQWILALLKLKKSKLSNAGFF